MRCLTFLVVALVTCAGCDQLGGKNEPPIPLKVGSARIQFLEFHADWCGPCRAQKPIVDRVRKDYPDVEFHMLDIDVETEWAARYNVRSIPTMCVLVDGQVFDRMVGMREQNELNAVLNRARAQVANRPK